MIQSTRLAVLTMSGLAMLGSVAAPVIPLANADNKRLNDGVVANVFTIQHQAGCTNDVKINPKLQFAAQQHAADLLNNRALDRDVGSNGSTPQDRARDAGFAGNVDETVAINPALAINDMDILNQWYYNPADLAIMSNCANTDIGVWSENSADRSVAVAVYGRPSQPRPASPGENIPIDPSPSYDASDELEFGVDWFAWILRGRYPPPAYPPS